MASRDNNWRTGTYHEPGTGNYRVLARKEDPLSASIRVKAWNNGKISIYSSKDGLIRWGAWQAYCERERRDTRGDIRP